MGLSASVLEVAEAHRKRAPRNKGSDFVSRKKAQKAQKNRVVVFAILVSFCGNLRA